MLTQYEYSQLCIDSTHGMRGFDFHLTTLLTINDSGVSLPVAFCISNVVNEDLMGLFFSIILKECGNIRASVFTSNEIPVFINAWCKVKSSFCRQYYFLLSNNINYRNTLNISGHGYSPEMAS